MIHTIDIAPFAFRVSGSLYRAGGVARIDTDFSAKRNGTAFLGRELQKNRLFLPEGATATRNLCWLNRIEAKRFEGN